MEVKLYEKADGTSEVRDLIYELERNAATSKDARIRLNKLVLYIDTLKQYGTRVGEPVVKHIDGDIWELRSFDDRVMFFFAKDDAYILLHHFVKKTRKTPPRETEQAKREMKDYIERNA
jgi:phage-related protein